MKVCHRWLLVFLAVSLFFTVSHAANVMAADCKDMLAAAKKERSLLKQSKILEEAVQKCPDAAAVNYRYGYALERLRKYDDALKHYKKAVKLDRKKAKYYFGMGDIYFLMKKSASAINAFEKGLKLDPSNSRARRSLDQLLPKTKKIEVAEKIKAPKEKQKKVEKKPKEKPVKKKLVEKKPPVQKKALEKKPKMAKKKVTAAATPQTKKDKPVKVVNGPTLKPEAPDNADFAVLPKALENDIVRHSKDDLSSVSGGPEFKAKLVDMLEKMRNSAETDKLMIDSESLQVVR